ncbi:hypothetical protein BK120_32465 [Paenibacillus sp. FSL A5-0031]|uniref:protein kinase domain-containing protein n=1 Tax=Paenibacillus sp. FSL A5-0031 TaxID=1920420 RepID=UPI00096ED7D5|nr:protein kinase [Paenibacillus sp. FSL A5-0031]OME73993.1 hypothetical protein BK120_32465 [Paenibacillus sp. FSL A5-0031]
MNSEISMYQEIFLNERNIKLERRIDEGSGVSFQGYHENFKKKVFVKFIPNPWDEGQSIQSEVDALINLKDKRNIVSVYDAFFDAKTESQLVIVTEYLEGNTLDKVCGLNNISLRQTLDIAMEILIGLNEIHNLGLVHRDLKLENIIYDGIKPIIIDLGSVKATNSKVHHNDPIPHLYRSSEIYNKSIYSVKSDIYQVGVIMYQLINGAFPLEQDFYASMLKKSEVSSSKQQDAEKQIKKLVTSGKLLTIVPQEPIYCTKLKRVINNAIKLRYRTLDEFYKELTRLKGEIPDWTKDNTTGDYFCKEWKKNKYRVVQVDTEFKIYKHSVLRSRQVSNASSTVELNKYFQTI